MYIVLKKKVVSEQYEHLPFCFSGECVFPIKTEKGRYWV